MCKPSMTKMQPWKIPIFKRTHDELQTLHFDTLTLSPTKANCWKVVKNKDNLAHRVHDVGIII
jgi:hypothetical protein